MASPTDPRLRVLLAVRLAGVATVADVARRTGLGVGEVGAVLDVAERAGLVRERTGSLAGWSLTGAGRVEGTRLLAADIDARGVRRAVEHAYGAFLVVNKEALAACTAWQVRDEATGTLNDHTDAAYDRAVLNDIETIVATARPVLEALAEAGERWRGYGSRVRAALDLVHDGDLRWLDAPMIDSFHTVWFELHEDLLATLGVERADEGEH